MIRIGNIWLNPAHIAAAVRVDVEGSSTKGRTAVLLARGFFATARKSVEVHQELNRTGSEPNNKTLGKALAELVVEGFLTRETAGYREAPGMKNRIKGV